MSETNWMKLHDGILITIRSIRDLDENKPELAKAKLQEVLTKLREVRDNDPMEEVA